MKVKTASLTCDAFRFSGTITSALEADEWLKGFDVTDTEVGWQGDVAPVGLDLTNEHGLTTLEAGDYLIHYGGKVHAEPADSFHVWFAVVGGTRA